MTILTFPPIVPNSVYYIRTTDRTPPLYFEWQSNNEVRPTELKPVGETQKWKIVWQQDKTYTITNVASDAQLSIKEYSEGTQNKYRLYSGGSQHWHLDVRGDGFVISAADSEKCVDIAENNSLILSERRNATDQRFVLDSVKPLVATAGNADGSSQTTGGVSIPATSTAIQQGTWNIKNRVTNGQLAISDGWPLPESPVRGWDAGTGSTSHAEVPRVWTLARSGDGYTFTNSQSVGNVPRYLNGGQGPVVNSTHNVCRIVAVVGEPYYYIAVGTGDKARVLHDPNQNPYNNGLILLSDYNKDETRQHWEFYPPAA